MELRAKVNDVELSYAVNARCEVKSPITHGHWRYSNLSLLVYASPVLLSTMMVQT